MLAFPRLLLLLVPFPNQGLAVPLNGHFLLCLMRTADGTLMATCAAKAALWFVLMIFYLKLDLRNIGLSLISFDLLIF